MKKFFKIIGIIATAFIIVVSIIEFTQGKKADWFLFFIAWGSILINELQEL